MVCTLTPFQSQDPTQNFDNHSLHQDSSELLDLTWLPLNNFGDLPLARITRVILGDVNAALSIDSSLPFDAPIPFYHFRHGQQIRDRI